MTDETENPQPIEVTPAQPGEIPAVGDSTTSLAAPSEPEPVIAPTPIIAPDNQTKETFWQKAEDDLEDAITWLKAELAKL